MYFNTKIDAIKWLRQWSLTAKVEQVLLTVDTKDGLKTFDTVRPVCMSLLDAKHFCDALFETASRYQITPDVAAELKELKYQVQTLRQNLDNERSDNDLLRRKIRSITDVIDND